MNKKIKGWSKASCDIFVMKSNRAEGTEDQELYDLIDRNDWDGALALIDPSQYEDKQELFRMINSRDVSPLVLILKNSFDGLSSSAKTLCLQLIDIGGETFVNRCDDDGSALHHACCIEDVELIHKLVEVGGMKLISLTEKYDGQTALHRTRSLEEATLLIEVGGVELVLIQDAYGRTALHTIFDFLDTDFMEIFHLLLDVGGEELVLMPDRDGKTALFYAFGNTMTEHDIHEQVVHDILEVGGRKLTLLTDRDGRTALHTACDHWVSYPESVSLLLEVAGNTLTLMTDRDGKTALHCDMKNTGIHVPYLLGSGGEKLALMTDRDGRTALHDACDWEKDLTTEAYRQLIEVGGEKLLFMTDRFGSTALHLASEWMWKHYPEIYRQMLDIGKEKLVFITDDYGRTVLHELCNRGHTFPEAVQLILDFGGEKMVLKTDRYGSTALHCACRNTVLPSIESSDIESVSSNSSDDTSERKALLNKIETVYRMVDVGRVKLLQIRDGENRTAMQIELQHEDPSEEIIDRFIEIAGKDFLLDKLSE